MTTYILKILFVISKSRINRKGVAPINCRITYNQKRKEFATGLFINPDFWNSKKQKALPPLKENEFINSQLSLISQKISKAFLMLQIQEIAFDVEDVFVAYKGKNTKKNKGFMEVLELHLQRMEKLVGTEYAARYYQKWKGTEKLLKEFIHKTYHKSDMILDRLTMKFLADQVICILILFHLSGSRNFKHFYLHYVQKHLQAEFPQTVSYNRFIELQQKVAIPLGIFLKTQALGKCTGISFIDSTLLRCYHIKREYQHKTFKNSARKGKCSLGWFYGFKLHLIINDTGEVLDFMLTQGNVDDRETLKNRHFHKNIFGKLVGDKGYMNKNLFEQLFVDGVHLITKIRKNMKNSLMLTYDKILLRKRALIETVNDQLKNICQIEHTRHRSLNNFVTNLLSGILAYQFLDKKPTLNLEIKQNIAKA